MQDLLLSALKSVPVQANNRSAGTNGLDVAQVTTYQAVLFYATMTPFWEEAHPFQKGVPFIPFFVFDLLKLSTVVIQQA
jgi:hypothetical protein